MALSMFSFEFAYENLTNPSPFEPKLVPEIVATPAFSKKRSCAAFELKPVSEIYLQNAVGVSSENSADVLEAIEKELNIVAMYDDQIAMLEKYFKE